MNKVNKILLLVLMVFMAIPNLVFAETKIERIIGDEGIDFKIASDAFVNGKTYKYGLSGISTESPKYIINETFVEDGKINISFDGYTDNEWIRKYDTVYLTVKDGDNYILEAEPLDMKLPLLESFVLTENRNGYRIKIRYSDILVKYNFYYIFEEITDNKIISDYSKGVSLDKLSLKGFSDIPKENAKWVYGDLDPYAVEISNTSLPKENGLYYIWLKAKGEDTKTIYGYTILKIENGEMEENVTKEELKTDENATKEESITNTAENEDVKNPSTGDINIAFVMLGLVSFAGLALIANKKIRKVK